MKRERERKRETENRLESSGEINEKYQDTERRKEARELKRRRGLWRKEDNTLPHGRRGNVREGASDQREGSRESEEERKIEIDR